MFFFSIIVLLQAHQLASKHLDSTEVSKMYIGQAQELEEQGRFKDAEKLYISVNEPDLAISMYKKQRQYEAMMRLVQTYHPDLVQSTHTHLAQELEGEGNHKSAEQHYVSAGDWKSAVHMYRGVDLWEDAYRVAQAHGGPHAAKQVNRMNIRNVSIDLIKTEMYRLRSSGPKLLEGRVP